jgi:magnesium chelatase family protein
MGILPAEEMLNYLILGELSLDGSIVQVSGALPAAIGANSRSKGIICPSQNGKEAAWSGNTSILAPNSLLALINHFKGTQILSQPEISTAFIDVKYPDLYDIKGQEIAKRALEIAACGGHNLIMSGPPGTGKSMLAKRLAGILPLMSAKEMLECSMIASVAGMINEGQLQYTRPYRAPHHSCTLAAMVGGGSGRRISPGEVSLAHNGVLFLDELPEFPRVVLDSLRQPTETGEISISRASSRVTFPAKFQLIAAMNPCRCGYLSDKDRNCNRAPKCATEYQAKISGPMLDRIDLHIEVASLSTKDLEINSAQETTENISKRVALARKIQQERYEGFGITTNSELDGQLLLEMALPHDDGKDLLNQAVEKFKLSMRGYNRVLRVARTIADMEGSRNVVKLHIAEALSYRPIVTKNS